MSIKNKIKNFVKKKNLNPMNNRKKVGIILFATSIGLFFLFAFRLTYIVASGKVAGVSLAEKTAELYQGSRVVKAKRGSILDRNGEVIAEDATSYSVYAILSDTYLGEDNKKLYAQEKDFEAIAEVLSKYTNLKKEDALEYLKNNKNEDGSSKYQVEFGSEGKGISIDDRQKIEKELEDKGIEGLYFTGHPARIYPNGVFSSHFIGYVDQADVKDESKGLIGKMGLEEAYNDVLSGKDGKIEYQKDVYGNPLPGTTASEEKAVDGEDIYTTLDVKIQSRLEELMDPVMEEYKPENMTAVLMKANSGEILAMTQRPSFNPETKDTLGKEGGAEWRNILVEDQFEPGSTMKIFTTAAAIEEGIFNPNETFAYPYGGYKLDDRFVNDHDEGKKGTLTFRQALSWSSNVGMLTLEQKMGGEKWKEYLEKFGFGQSTNSGLLGESAGGLPGDNWVDQAMSSFGQAINVTNFQMMQAYTAVANNGTMLKPQFIKKIVNNSTGEETETQTEVIGTPIQAQTATDIRSYLVDTVEDPTYGIAYDVYTVDGYHIAAKTGTAEITGENGYQGGSTDYTYSVVEMIPAENPEYILYLTMKKPQLSDKTALSKIANPLLQFVMDTQNSDSSK